MRLAKIKRYLKMKKVLVIVLWVAALAIGYFIRESVNAPVAFEKLKKERYQEAINRLKVIKKAQEAYKGVYDNYTSDYGKLISCIEKDFFTVTTQRDSSFLRYDEAYGVDREVDTVVIDTLGTVSVKDSMFKNIADYKEMSFVPGAEDSKAQFKLEAKKIEVGAIKVPVFKASVSKEVLLYDQDEAMVKKELNIVKDDREVDGKEISVGSLTKVSTTGNWPMIYDKKEDK